jgi:hypothetical protein
MITISITDEEDQLAIKAGIARQERRVIAGVERDSYSFRDNVTTGHIDGVRGEIVLSKALGMPWTETAYSRGEADLGGLIEARLRTKHWYEMIILPKDNDDRLYFLITKEANDPLYQVHGYVLGSEGKNPEWWKQVTSNRPTFFVPQQNLHPIEILLGNLLEARRNRILNSSLNRPISEPDPVSNPEAFGALSETLEVSHNR